MDSNVISQTQIYDYSYLPPKPIGYNVTFCDMDGNVQFDRNALLGMAADEVISVAIKQLDPIRK